MSTFSCMSAASVARLLRRRTRGAECLLQTQPRVFMTSHATMARLRKRGSRTLLYLLLLVRHGCFLQKQVQQVLNSVWLSNLITSEMMMHSEFILNFFYLVCLSLTADEIYWL